MKVKEYHELKNAGEVLGDAGVVANGISGVAKLANSFDDVEGRRRRCGPFWLRRRVLYTEIIKDVKSKSRIREVSKDGGQG